MAINTQQERETALLTPWGAVLPLPDLNINSLDKAQLAFTYAGIEVPISQAGSDIIPRHSRIDSIVKNHGKRYTLTIQADKPDRASGMYMPSSSENIYMRRVKGKGNPIGKTRTFLTTYQMFGQRKPLRNMRLGRNGLTHMIVEITKCGNNEFLLTTETV